MSNVVARITDIGGAHEEYAPVPIVEGSNDVFANTLGVARKGDKLAPQVSPITGATHIPSINQGSDSVFANSKNVARIFDAISCGGMIITGAKDVFAG